MSRNEIIRLKLQMGIATDAPIDPNVLLTMWQQLQLENARLQRDRLRRVDKVTVMPMDA
jgi:hypothetical protein